MTIIKDCLHSNNTANVGAQLYNIVENKNSYHHNGSLVMLTMTWICLCRLASGAGQFADTAPHIPTPPAIQEGGGRPPNRVATPNFSAVRRSR